MISRWPSNATGCLDTRVGTTKYTSRKRKAGKRKSGNKFRPRNTPITRKGKLERADAHCYKNERLAGTLAPPFTLGSGGANPFRLDAPPAIGLPHPEEHSTI